MLKIKNLHTELRENNQKIIEQIDLEIPSGKVALVMGPNGSGKSTLVHSILGSEAYNTTADELSLDQQNLIELEIDERARAGVFLAFQSPVELPGVDVLTFLHMTTQAMQGESVSFSSFKNQVMNIAGKLQISELIADRHVNVGFSGGERKKFEILQMLLMRPKLILLDEIDSGLDIDAKRQIFPAIYDYVTESGASALVVSHYPEVTNYFQPDQVVIMTSGRVVGNGGLDLLEKVKSTGYGGL